MLENVTEARADNHKYKIINAITRIQELKGSTREFAFLQLHMKQRSAIDYVKSKKDFDNRLSSIRAVTKI